MEVITINKNSFFLLNTDLILGKSALSALKEYGPKAMISDFAILQGGGVSTYDFVDDISVLEPQTYFAGSWLAKNTYEFGRHSIINYNGKKENAYFLDDDIGIRPAVKFSDIKHKCTKIHVTNGITEIEYGEYPQKVVSEKYESVLSEALQNNRLIKTGKEFTFKIGYDNCEFDQLPEYEYAGKKYIKCHPKLGAISKKLSDDRQVTYIRDYWVEIQPVKWIVDIKKDIALCKSIMAAGFYLNEVQNIFLNQIFAQDIVPSTSKEIALLDTSKIFESDVLEYSDPVVKVISSLVEKIDAMNIHEIRKKDLMKRISSLLDDYQKEMHEVFAKKEILTLVSVASVRKKYAEKIAAIEIELMDTEKDQEYKLNNEIEILKRKLKSKI